MKSPASDLARQRSPRKQKKHSTGQPTARSSAHGSGATIDAERLRVALHDGLGQLLTSISFLASSLNQRLTAQELPEAAEAHEILSLATRAISETQALVRDF